jgi:hypothetical protein
MPLPAELPDPLLVALGTGERLDGVGIPWVVAGSLASSVHGEPRATMDVDMVVGLRSRMVTKLFQALRADYYVDADAMRAAVRSAHSFNAVHLASAIKVDFFVAGDDPFEAARLASRMPVDMSAGVLYVDTAEHTILRKLEWYRRGGEISERQWRDVQAIVRIQGDRLDRRTMQKWSEHLGVTDLLARVLNAAAP